MPLLGRDVATYATAYSGYVAEHQDRAPLPLTPLDPAPRVILDPELGLLAAGQSAAETGVILDIALHTAAIVERAERLEEWRALPPADVFDVEYWDLEQAKLRAAGPPRPFAGEVALVTGAASGIGRACARRSSPAEQRLSASISTPPSTGLLQRPRFLGIRCDITDEDAVRDALETAGRAFGGLDMLVLNAGIFPSGTPIAALTLEDWSRTLRVNLDANVTLLREAHPLLRLASRGRARRGHRVEERACARARCGRVLRLEGRVDPTRARGRPRVGRRRDSRQRRSSERGLRHRRVDR